MGERRDPIDPTHLRKAAAYLNFSQSVLLNFNGLSSPHVQVATLEKR